MASTLGASWIITWTLGCIINRHVEANLILNGTNVCSSQESFSQSYTVSVQQSVNKQVSYKCRNQQQWPFLYKTCYKNVVAYQVGYNQLYKAAYGMKYFCCSGWKPTGNACTTPICSQGCYNGTCVMPNVCTCLPGYHGAACDKPCESSKWGPGCTNTCQCNNNATCDMRNGSCSCLPGWQGTTCDRACQQCYYGNNCAQACTCQNGASCDHATGDCSCSAGWQGQQCNASCGVGHYGDKCQDTCKCRNNATCDHVTGVCLCEPGYQGTFCEKPCNSGFYGNRCREACRCYYGDCDHVSGRCTCKTGYVGSRCTETCPSGIYGNNCSISCSCHQSALCDPKDGSCTCDMGFIGESCDQKCPSGYYGNQCQEKCNCYSNESCDHVDGNCTCNIAECTERFKEPQGKTSSANKDPLLPAIISVVAILIIIAVATACFIYRKRRNQRMRNNRKNDEPVYECSDKNGVQTPDKEHDESYQLVTQCSKPTYMELTGVSGNGCQDDGIQNLTYQKLVKESRESHFNDVSSVSMETQYAGLRSPKETDNVYQPLQRESVKQGRVGDRKRNGSDTALSQTNAADSYNVKGNPGFEPESPSHYENVAAQSRTDLKQDENASENVYLELLSDEDHPGKSTISGQPTYEILPSTANNQPPIYDNL